MRLGINVGYWQREPDDATETVLAAERQGYDSVFTAEAYGSDAFTALAWYGARTSRIRLGTAVVQMSARPPAATAMHALTLDALSGGRLTLGIGASGPQVVEGWYGVPFPKPLARTREYVRILRDVWRREAPVTADGPHYPLPYPGGAGLGKPLKSIVHPLRREIPIFLGAEGPKNVALAAEIADGWLPFLFSPSADAYYRDRMNEGFGRRAPERSPRADFEVVAGVPTAIDDDLERAADQIRPWIALYVGGMGAKDVNFHADVVARLGYEKECA